jgi:hypothetical protein
MRHGARLRGAAVVAALVAACVPAATATAKPPRAFYGVVTQTELGDADLDRMATGRVGTLRITLAWTDIDRTPLPGDLDWGEFDRAVASSARHGIRVLPTVFGTPHWVALAEGCERAARSCAIFAPRTEIGLAAWRSFLVSALSRYGPGGAFWVQHPELAPQPIRTWQIWNEENSPGFFGPQPDPRSYVLLVRAASEVIRAQDPGARLILGGMFGEPVEAGGAAPMPASEYLRRLYESPGFAAHFDGIAIHPYAGRMKRVKPQVRRLRAVSRRAGDGRVGIWVTETGWGSGKGPSPLDRGIRGQAQRLRQSLRYFTRQRERLGIELVAWYAWRDAPSEAGICAWCATSGLFEHGSLTAKPAWDEFVGFTGGK